MRISREKGDFEKCYQVGWTEELFETKPLISTRKQLTCYCETFYERECSEGEKEDKDHKDDNSKNFTIERLIQTTRKGPKLWYFDR